MTFRCRYSGTMRDARYLRLPSAALGRRVHLWAYGHWGTRSSPFPPLPAWPMSGRPSARRCAAAASRRRTSQTYRPESDACRSWTATDRSAEERLASHAAYERFIREELVAFIEADCWMPGARIGVVGASLGATYAALSALKAPERFPWALCLSGRYRTTPMLGGRGGDDAYFNDPLAFVPNLSGGALDRVRQGTHLTLVVGTGPHENRCIPETVALARALHGRGIRMEPTYGAGMCPTTGLGAETATAPPRRRTRPAAGGLDVDHAVRSDLGTIRIRITRTRRLGSISVGRWLLAPLIFGLGGPATNPVPGTRCLVPDAAPRVPDPTGDRVCRLLHAFRVAAHRFAPVVPRALFGVILTQRVQTLRISS